MSSLRVGKKFIPTIGIECHVQLKTQTKLFAAVGNDARQAPPNSLISHICLGMPGALPVLNQEAVEYAVRVAFAFGTRPQTYSYFERKHYFYPDLPKGYQITQLHQPIIVGGFVEIDSVGKRRRIRLNRAQLEEDAGKSIHPAGQNYSLVDLNRAGTPLLEVVSEPDMHSAEEAKAYAQELYLLMRYAGVSDADMYHGNMRFDVNVSVSQDPTKLGIRTETKNLNSFRSVEKAVQFEIDRQTDLLQKGKPVVQETRGWSEAKQKTVGQRGKEEAHDYRYFPDPDLPPLELSPAFTRRIKQTMPTLPAEWRQRLAGLGLSASQIDGLLLAEVEDQRISYLGLLEQKLHDKPFAKSLANWFVNVEIPLRREDKAERSSNELRLKQYKGVYDLLTAGKLSSTNARSLLVVLLTHANLPHDFEKYASEQGYIQVSDEAELAVIINEVMADNAKVVADIKKGETKAIGFLVGQVMKKTLGKANPELTQKLIQQRLR